MSKVKILQKRLLTASPFMVSEIKKALDISENSIDEEYAREKYEIEEMRKAIKEAGG